jgi:RecB family endonuclease NucS
MERYLEHLNTICKSLDKNEIIVIASSCTVSYHGKVESILPLGERLIIIKADKTLLVHQPDGTNPINYMKEGSEHTLLHEKGAIIIKSQNIFNKDFLEIVMQEIFFINSHYLEDGSKIQITGSEADMSDMIYNNPSLIEKGFKPFSREEHTKFGFIDVFGTDANRKMVIIECKRDFADFKAVSQLHRYVHKMIRSKGVKINDIRGIIAAPRITENAEKMLVEQGFEFRAVTPPKYLAQYDKKQRRLADY